MYLSVVRHFLIGLITVGILSVTTTSAFASSFQLWEQSAATAGNYHAGYAADALDASIAFYNPAGMTRIHNQQLVFGAVAIMTSFKYRGTVSVNTILDGMPRNVTAQGGTFNVVPNFHYVAPINDYFNFGLSVDVPFGLKTDYGRSTILRYAATLTSVAVIDISPSLGVKLTDNLSIGAGFDIQKMRGEFDSVAGSGMAENDTQSVNRASDTGYGYHAGVLYEFNPHTRVGASYHSQVVHHLSGTSRFSGPIADNINDAYDLPPGPIVSENAHVNVTLPPYTALSIYHEVDPRLALMGSVIYTQWSTFRNLALHNVAGVDLAMTEFGPLPAPSTNLTINVPEHYRNTWSASVGANYYLTDRLMVRGGVGFDQTPVRNQLRNVQLPDDTRYVAAIGGHYQATKCLGFDLGWIHLFMNQVDVNPPPLVEGIEAVATNGKVGGGADVFAVQVTWDIV